MAKSRVRSAVRKAALALEREQLDRADEVAMGVRAVAKEIMPMVQEGALYWTAPFQYVAEQMAIRVCREYELPAERHGDVAGYLLAAWNEYVTAMVGHFDVEHFEAWIAAQGVIASG